MYRNLYEIREPKNCYLASYISLVYQDDHSQLLICIRCIILSSQFLLLSPIFSVTYRSFNLTSQDEIYFKFLWFSVDLPTSLSSFSWSAFTSISFTAFLYIRLTAYIHKFLFLKFIYYNFVYCVSLLSLKSIKSYDPLPSLSHHVTATQPHLIN